jgi:hypothetical protein
MNIEKIRPAGIKSSNRRPIIQRIRQSDTLVPHCTGQQPRETSRKTIGLSKASAIAYQVVQQLFSSRSLINARIRVISGLSFEKPQVLAHDAYDRRGELFKSFANWLTYRDRPVPDARIAIYPFKRVFEVAETTTDVKSGLAETCFLPSPDTKERETWYINMGAATMEMFTLQALVEAAH